MGATLKAANEVRHGASFHGEDTRSDRRRAESGLHKVARPVGILRGGSRSDIVGAALRDARIAIQDALRVARRYRHSRYECRGLNHPVRFGAADP